MPEGKNRHLRRPFAAFAFRLMGAFLHHCFTQRCRICSWKPRSKRFHSNQHYQCLLRWQRPYPQTTCPIFSDSRCPNSETEPTSQLPHNATMPRRLPIRQKKHRSQPSPAADCRHHGLIRYYRGSRNRYLSVGVGFRGQTAHLPLVAHFWCSPSACSVSSCRRSRRSAPGSIPAGQEDRGI